MSDQVRKWEQGFIQSGHTRPQLFSKKITILKRNAHKYNEQTDGNEKLSKSKNKCCYCYNCSILLSASLHIEMLSVPALILTACGVSRLLMLSMSTFLSSSVRSNPSRIEGSLTRSKSYTKDVYTSGQMHLRPDITQSDSYIVLNEVIYIWTPTW